MTQKIRDRVKDIIDFNIRVDMQVKDIEWLCTTIEKLCDVMDTYRLYTHYEEEVEPMKDNPFYRDIVALKEWEDQ